MFDAQRAEQDDGVLECREDAGNAFYPEVYEVHSDAMQCFDVYKLLMSNDIDHLPASWSIYCGDELYWSGLTIYPKDVAYRGIKYLRILCMGIQKNPCKISYDSGLVLVTQDSTQVAIPACKPFTA